MEQWCGFFCCCCFFYQQVAVTAEANTGAAHPLQVDVGALCLDVAEASLQGTLLGEQRLQPGENTPVSSLLAMLANNNKQDLSFTCLVLLSLARYQEVH